MNESTEPADLALYDATALTADMQDDTISRLLKSRDRWAKRALRAEDVQFDPWDRIEWADMRPGQRVRLTHTESGDVFHGEAREGNGCMVVYGRLDYAYERDWDVVEVYA